MFRPATSAHVCRAATSDCDITERCTGTAATCPADAYVFPGVGCTTATSSGTFAGKCYAKKCHSLEETCTHKVGATVNKTLDTNSSTCVGLNDACSGYVHVLSFFEPRRFEQTG